MIRKVLTGASPSQEEHCVLGWPNCQHEKERVLSSLPSIPVSSVPAYLLRTVIHFSSCHSHLYYKFISDVIYWYLARTPWAPWGLASTASNSWKIFLLNSRWECCRGEMTWWQPEAGFRPKAICFQCSFLLQIYTLLPSHFPWTSSTLKTFTFLAVQGRPGRELFFH